MLSQIIEGSSNVDVSTNIIRLDLSGNVEILKSFSVATFWLLFLKQNKDNTI